jgi:glucosamine kinase
LLHIKNKIDKDYKQEQPLFLGIDGGGSKCKAILMDQNNTSLGTGISGPGNPVYGSELAKISIVESASLALTEALLNSDISQELKLNDICAGIGLAGVNLPHVYDEMIKWQSPFKSIYLTTDIHIACLGAHEGHDGAVLISGTGTCGLSNVKNHSKIIGGHGFPQGDKGSGAWYGLNAVEAVLLALDEMAPPTTISKYMCQVLKASTAEEIISKVAGKPASFFARLANTVFSALEDKDEVALAIIDEGASYISKMARLLLKTTPPRISFIGGLAEWIIPYLDQDIQKQLSPSLFPPEAGAVFYARHQTASLK